jgi:hypothetical protein
MSSEAQNNSATDVSRLNPQKAVWIASYPKSGNTWVRVFLHNLMLELRGEIDAVQNINALHEWTDRESLAVRFARHFGKSPDALSSREIALARPQIQADMVAGRDGPVFIKTHNAVARVEGVSTLNFEITLASIYIIRNPLDVAISYAKFMDVSIDATIAYMEDPSANIETSAKRVYEFMGSWSYHVASWVSVPHRPVLILRYEDMLAAPERAFGRLAAFLRLKPTPDQLQRAIQKSSFAEMVHQEQELGFSERPDQANAFFREGRAGQWREGLTQSQIHDVTQAHAPMMMRFGYLREEINSLGQDWPLRGL